MSKKNRNAIINLIITTILIFALILIGLKIVSGNMLLIQNILALLGFSLILGVVSSVLYLFQQKLGYYIYDLGIVIGLAEMYRSFYSDPNGWGDLTGLASLFFWILIGLGVGLIVQLIFSFYTNYKKKV